MAETITPLQTGLYKYDFINEAGKPETKLITLSEAMLNVGIWAVAAQDGVLAGLTKQMTDQTEALEDINEIMGILDIYKRAWQDWGSGKSSGDLDGRTVPMLSDQRQDIEAAIALYNKTAAEDKQLTLKNPITYAEFRTLRTALRTRNTSEIVSLKALVVEYNKTQPEGSKIAISDPLTNAEALKMITALEGKEVSSTLKAQMQTCKTMIGGADAVNDIPDGDNINILSKEVQKVIKSLVANYGLNLGTVDITAITSLEKLEELMKNLSTVQSSQGAVNEDLSLRLNQAASERSAIFSQLQTLLQTLMQTIRQLSNW
ncbi:hypothetical protein LJC09_01150 [Desulfovibrio sp. OttesenSCG-928-F20]|nr:hypothetical protein [Desulfovibrio sp. OttesenSCG-928-F20]